MILSFTSAVFKKDFSNKFLRNFFHMKLIWLKIGPSDKTVPDWLSIRSSLWLGHSATNQFFFRS